MGDALSQKHQAIVSMMLIEWKELEVLSSCNLQFRRVEETIAMLASLDIRPSLLVRIQANQRNDPILADQINQLKNGNASEALSKFELDLKGNLKFKGRLCVPNTADLRKEVLDECHRSLFSIHPGGSKMSNDMKRMY